MLEAWGIGKLWALVRRLPWRQIGLAFAAAYVLYVAYLDVYGRGFHARDAEVAALNGTIKNLRDASAKAQADNHAFVQRINAQQDQITKDRNDEAPKLRDAGRAAIDAYVRLHPAPQAAPRLSYATGASGLSDAAGEPDAAGTAAVVPRADLDACNDAYVIATGLQGWIRDQAAIDRNEVTK